MAPVPPLFSIPVKRASGPPGSITATSPAKGVYVLTFDSGPDNRLTPAFIAAVHSALDELEFAHPPGCVITTSAIAKFYSNGLDLASLTGPYQQSSDFLEHELYPLFRRFLTYPHPTVALLNGHAFAGGLMLAMCHDYRLQAGGRGFACVNELDIGFALKPAMSGIFREKLSPAAYRAAVLEAKRFTAQESLAAGVVDAIGASVEEAVAFAAERKLAVRGKTGIYGVMKGEMYRGVIKLLETHKEEDAREAEVKKAEQRRVVKAKELVKSSKL
jgi:Delta3-Delta2-enoyl-CoA isomerase